MAKFNLENYIPVHERITAFYEVYPEGRIKTSVEHLDVQKGFVLMKAEIYRTPLAPQPSATGHAFEYKDVGFVNKTSWVENAESSAVGRALALLGFKVERGIASREEMEKVERMSDGYRVDGHLVTKPNGKIICTCGELPDCKHIEEVRRFAKSAVASN